MSRSVNSSLGSESSGPVINEGFTQGGDLVLRSLDGIDFHVHAVVLSVVSPVFADMLAVGTRRGAVNVAETAEALALMLNFIYHRPPLLIPSFTVLELGMHTAEKYQLDNMKAQLRNALCISHSPVSAYSHPLRALAFASAHNLREEANLAATLASSTHNFGNVDDLLKLASAMPYATGIVKIVGIPLARITVLVDILFNFHQSPMSAGPSCSACDNPHTQYMNYQCQYSYSPPEWKARWAHWAFQELRSRSIAECGGVFKLGFLNTAMCRGTVSFFANTGCKCLSVINQDGGSNFESWANGVRKVIEQRLPKLAQLESLV